MRPIPHNEALPIPKPPANVIVDNEDFTTDEASCSSSEPHLLTQGDLNDLVRDLNLSKKRLTS
jgi:hypothetical protein